MRILTISGSLQTSSSNTALLELAAATRSKRDEHGVFVDEVTRDEVVAVVAALTSAI